MTVTIEEAKAFIAQATKSRADFKTIADASWDEIEKRAEGGKLYSMSRGRRKGKYPAWWSINKIRRPLYFSRLGIPISRDTSEDGSDSIGATAALLKERLARNLPKDIDLKDVIEVCRDDFAATDFTMARGYYERVERKEQVKEYLQVGKDAQGKPVALDSRGKPVVNEEVLQDEDGTFIYLNQVIDVEDEKVCIEPVLYDQVYIDPGIRRWERCRRLAFELYYSKPEFVEMFGQEALTELKYAAWESNDESFEKNQDIKVYEYWDDYEKETYWFSMSSKKFLTPLVSAYNDDSDKDEPSEKEASNGLLNLRKFWPCTPPVILNASSKKFWPTPEFYQINDLFLEVDNLFSKMMRTTRAIRAKLMFDNNIEGLESALSELSESEAIGVPNLSAALTKAGGNINNAAQYLDISALISSLETTYKALEQRLNLIYKLTGTSDLLQGLITDGTQRTFGERQMTEKYALNQIAEPQSKMADFNRDILELACEIAIKNFKDENLEKYLIPRTLPPEHQQNYGPALQLLKQDDKRFRLELETDSTIAINEQYDKQMRQELTQTITNSLEKAAEIATSQPALLQLELHALKFLIQGFRQSKLFQGEFTAAIDAVVKQSEDAAKNAKPEFNKDEAMYGLEQARLQFEQAKQGKADEIEMMKIQSDSQMEQYKINTDAQIESSKMQLEQMKMQQDAQIASLANQLETFKAQVALGKNQGELQLGYEKMKADLETESQALQIKRDELMATVQQFASTFNIDAFTAQVDNQVKMFEVKLAAQEHELEKQKVMLDEREKYMTEARLQSEHQLEQSQAMVKSLIEVHHAKLATEELRQKAAEIQVAPPAAPKKTKKKIKVQRDAEGNLLGFEAETE